jgi:predicted O-methyltransferase YrrM
MAKVPESVLDYYKSNHFNPVPIFVEERAALERHVCKRQNLYARHLGIPLSLLRGARVLEFGPNSGENALVLALFGARLTLVEPNDQVLPRLEALFKKFGVAQQIEALHCTGIAEYDGQERYDLVIAEGFLYALSNRDAMFRKCIRYVRPGGLGVISFNDVHGGFLEFLRRAIVCRVCALSGITDLQSAESIQEAKRLFGEDFARLNASRPFEAWCTDTLVAPFYGTDFCWSFPTILATLSEQQCTFHSSSPLWATDEHYNWYKNVHGSSERYQSLLQNWKAKLSYFVTGIQPDPDDKPDEGACAAVQRTVSGLSAATRAPDPQLLVPDYPEEFRDYLASRSNPRVQICNKELGDIFEALKSSEAAAVRAAYARSSILRRLWGTPYHYVSFQTAYTSDATDS